MSKFSNPASLSSSQKARLQPFDAMRSVDCHCHCLPGVDDGPKSIEDALLLCRMLVQDGFTDVIATPHQLGRYDGLNAPPDIRAMLLQLQARLDAAAIPLTLHAGGEVRLDERVDAMILDDRINTLADTGRQVLLELPANLQIAPAAVTALTTHSGTQIVLAHPERYDMLRRDPPAAAAWIAAGVLLQVNAASILGDAGPASRGAALRWIEAGWVSIVATDAHNIESRRPRMSEAIELILAEFGVEMTRQICIDNPAMLLPSATSDRPNSQSGDRNRRSRSIRKRRSTRSPRSEASDLMSPGV